MIDVTAAGGVNQGISEMCGLMDNGRAGRCYKAAANAISNDGQERRWLKQAAHHRFQISDAGGLLGKVARDNSQMTDKEQILN